jgi:RNA polymerase sigma-70 factor (ECF subfamily)
MREDLLREHGGILLRRAMLLRGNRSDAMDLVQDTWERAWSRYTSAVTDDKLLAWLLVIMRNLHVDGIRRHKARGDLVAQSVEIEGLPAPEPDTEPDPPWADLSVEEIRPSIDNLTPSMRAAFELHTFERRSYSEIARVLKIPTATVGTRLLRARRRLRSLVSPLGTDAAPFAGRGRPMLDKSPPPDGRPRPRTAGALACG